MEKARHTLRCAVYAIFIKDKQVLLCRRKNTGWMDGYYGLPQGHLDKGESLKEALVREVKEETGIAVDESDITFYHVMHRTKPGSIEYVDFYFKIEYWKGEPAITEPDKCDEMLWCDLDRLPDNIIPTVKAALSFFKGRIIFSEML